MSAAPDRIEVVVKEATYEQADHWSATRITLSADRDSAVAGRWYGMLVWAGPAVATYNHLTADQCRTLRAGLDRVIAAMDGVTL